MILTITLNPAVDISYTLDTLTLDGVNRVSDVSKTAGGKGLNVARVARQLEADVAATGFLGGSLGTFIREAVTADGIEDAFAPIAGDTRNCVAVLHDGQQTEILESGPTISDVERAEFLVSFTDTMRAKQVVTLSGSLPSGVPTDFYAQLLEITSFEHMTVILDTSGDALKAALTTEHKPYMIKPNETEFAALFGEATMSEAEMIAALATSEYFTGIELVVVTRGADGALVKSGETIYHATAPVIEAVNPVGSGDAVVAGFAVGLTRGLEDAALIKYGLAMGALNALEAQTGSIDPAKVAWALEQITVTAHKA